MKVKVKLYKFSGPRATASQVVDVPEGATVSQLLAVLRAQDEAAAGVIDRAVLVLNQRRAELEATLKDGDELAIYPVLGGGAR